MQTGQEPFVQPTGATGGGPHSSWWLGFEGEFFRMLHACFFLCTNTKRAVNDTLHTTPDTEQPSVVLDHMRWAHSARSLPSALRHLWSVARKSTRGLGDLPPLLLTERVCTTAAWQELLSAFLVCDCASFPPRDPYTYTSSSHSSTHRTFGLPEIVSLNWP